MTAPLPPLPKLPNFGQIDPHDVIGKAMHSYAKLVARQALERALLVVMDYHDRDAIRTMIKEYK